MSSLRLDVWIVSIFSPMTSIVNLPSATSIKFDSSMISTIVTNRRFKVYLVR